MRNAIQSALQGAVELLLTMPLLLIASHSLLPEANTPLAPIAVLLALYAAGGALAKPLRRAPTLLQWLVPAALSFAAMLGIAGVGAGAALFGLLGIVACWRGMRFHGAPWSALLPVAALWASFPLYFVGALLCRMYGAFEPLAGWIDGFGLANVAAVLLVNNQLHLQAEANAKKKSANALSSVVLHQNRMLTAGFVLIVLAVGFFSQADDLLASLRDRLVGFLSGLETDATRVQDEYVAGGAVGDGTAAESSGSTLWERIYMAVITTIVYIVAIAGAGLLVFLLFKRLGWLSRRIAKWFAARGRLGELAPADAGYEDENEQLLDWGALRSKAMERLRALREKPVRLEELADNRERVRYLFETLVTDSMRRGYVYKRHYTPEETGLELRADGGRSNVEETVEWYNRVRYGGAEPDDATVERIRRQSSGG